MTRTALSSAVGLVGVSLLPDRIRLIGEGNAGITAYLSDVFGCAVQVSLGVGTLRSNRKPVLEVFDESGLPLGFAKVGHSPYSARLVTHEASALQALAGVTWSLLCAPRLLNSGFWNGMPVLVMSSVPTSAPLWRNGRWPIPTGVTDELTFAFASGESPLSDTDLWKRLIASVDHTAVRSTVGRALDVSLRSVEGQLGDVVVPVTAWHGDFTPWNISRTRAGTAVWDWERFEQGVPLGLDRIHYSVQSLTQKVGFSAPSILAGIARARHRVADRAGQATEAAYLVTVAARHFEAAAATEVNERAATERGMALLDALDRFWELDSLSAGSAAIEAQRHE